MSEISVGTTLTTAFNVTGDLTGSLVVKTGSSATTALTLSATGNLSLATGNLTFSGTGQRITGDFSNATLANRLAFQTSTTNGNTIVGAFPNGTGTNTRLQLFSASDPANASTASMEANATSSLVIINADKTGTGTYLPMTFYTGGSERMRLDTSGNLGIGTASPATKLSVAVSGASDGITVGTGVDGTAPNIYVNGGSDGANGPNIFGRRNGSNEWLISSLRSITGGGAQGLANFVYGNNPQVFYTNSAERMRIDGSGNVGIGGSPGAASKLNVLGTYSAAGNNAFAVTANGSIPSGATTNGISFLSVPTTAAASFTCSQLSHFYASQGAFGAGSAVTNQFGFYVESTLTGATNNFGFYSNIASGSNRWNFYAAGTAQNYFAGNTGVGTTPSTSTRFRVFGIGTSSSNFTIYSQNSASTELFWVRDDGAFSTGVAALSPYNLTTGNAANVYLDAAGVLNRSTSSLRYKTDVADASHGLADVLKLRSVTYKGKNDGEKTFGGLIAEEVHDAGLTEFVAYDKEGRPDALHYGNMVALLVRAVQEQQEQIKALQDKIAALEAK